MLFGDSVIEVGVPADEEADEVKGFVVVGGSWCGEVIGMRGEAWGGEYGARGIWVWGVCCWWVSCFLGKGFEHCSDVLKGVEKAAAP